MHLPKLTRAAENGLIDWSMLREIVRKAVVETEDYWLKPGARVSNLPSPDSFIIVHANISFHPNMTRY